MLIDTLTLTNADQEYTFVLPDGARAFTFKCRNAATAYRFATVTGLVAGPTGDYVAAPAGMVYSSPPAVDLKNAASRTIYFASSSAGSIIEIIWFM